MRRRAAQQVSGQARSESCARDMCRHLGDQPRSRRDTNAPDDPPATARSLRFSAGANLWRLMPVALARTTASVDGHDRSMCVDRAGTNCGDHRVEGWDRHGACWDCYLTSIRPRAELRLRNLIPFVDLYCRDNAARVPIWLSCASAARGGENVWALLSCALIPYPTLWSAIPGRPLYARRQIAPAPGILSSVWLTPVCAMTAPGCTSKLIASSRPVPGAT